MKKIGKVLLVIIIIIGLLYSVAYFFGREKRNDMIIGVSFQTDYARYLGFNYQNVFKTILEDWKFKNIRIPAQWDSIEKEPGKFDFSEVDWMMNEAKKHQAKIVLAVGQKTPRWPECHAPDWTKDLSNEKYFDALHNYLALVVTRYKDHPALEIWQVENEPFLPFGERCRSLSVVEFKKEINNVRTLDNVHKILTADSGELSTWRRTARAGDLFGTTLYRVVWNKYIGYWSYDWLPPAFYRFKLWLTGQSPDNAYVLELQAEPWIPDKPLVQADKTEQEKSMSLNRLKKNIEFSSRLQFSRTYLWGAEWWYWLAQNGQNEIPDYIRDLVKNP